MNSEKIKENLLEIFFPSFCLICKKEGTYLCEDCKELLDISIKNKSIQIEGIDEVHYALTPENRYSKKIIDNYLGKNPIKNLSKIFINILQDHFSLSEKIPFNKEDLVITIPDNDKNINFDRRKELAKEFSRRFDLKYLENFNINDLNNKNIILIIDKLKNKEEIINFVKDFKTNRIILICVSL